MSLKYRGINYTPNHSEVTLFQPPTELMFLGRPYCPQQQQYPLTQGGKLQFLGLHYRVSHPN